jgi:hypothetical protein
MGRFREGVPCFGERRSQGVLHREACARGERRREPSIGTRAPPEPIFQGETMNVIVTAFA